MKTLPKYYCIKRDESSPLWKKYDKWIRNNGYNPLSDVWDYVGYDGCNTDNGYNGTRKISSFCNPVTLITLEFWDECVNGTQRKIIGYKAPFDLYGGIKKGNLFTKDHSIKWGYRHKNSYCIPDEIVETWEPVYEEEKLEVKYIHTLQCSDKSYLIAITTNIEPSQEIVDKIKEVIK